MFVATRDDEIKKKRLTGSDFLLRASDQSIALGPMSR